ncbi:NUDIX hydrolase, partial [Candidatus Gracilibacteria bacterium]|nr:NUDIX hydrolase [Candidatus Gracilibacteria bacterium]
MKKGNNIELTKNIFDLSIPVVAIDIVIFTIYKDKLSVVLTTRLKDPEKGKYIIPGGIARRGFSLEENFDAILLNKTGIKNIYKEQLYTFGDPKRDSRGHIISISYYALVNKDSFLENVDFTRVNIVEYSK